MENSDDSGQSVGFIVGIIDHRSTDEAVSLEDVKTKEGLPPRKNIITTKGWDLLVEWEGGATSWVPLKDIKAANCGSCRKQGDT
mmetsp:Transcript_16812/g.23805  ORF Transcript_16812/g.23805 Transcript_16812/m.23805 type:complete len:84 (+) Transcript_16812:3238-3489(+)